MNALERHARQHAIDDYCFDKPTQEQAFKGLTLGEEQRYYTQACRTSGAIYESRISGNTLSMKATLPDSLSLRGMTKKQAEGHERFLQNKMEDAIVWILRWQQDFGDSHD